MKHLLLLLVTALLAAATHAQPVAWLLRPRVSKMPYTVDSFTFHGETVPIQRFREADLDQISGADAPEKRVALTLVKLQESLDNIRAGVLARQRIPIIDEGRQYLDKINRQNTRFNTALLEAEYQLYYKYRNADGFDARYDGGAYSSATTRTKQQEEEAFKAELHRLWAEEAKRVQDSTDNAEKEAAQHKADSIATKQEQDAIAAKIKEDARRDAALKKKYGATAYNKAIKGEVWIGMTDELAARAAGIQSHTKRTTTSDGVREEWLSYDLGDEAYSYWSRKIIFRNHVIIAIEERH